MIRHAEAMRRSRAALSAGGIENAGFEARLLVAHVGGLARDCAPDPAAPIDADQLEALLARRIGREPMAYILGHQGFWTMDLAVSPVTLIPRADSEALIEAAQAARPDAGSVRRVLDLGTGTGCLLLAALTVFPEAWGLGIDRVPQAAALAAHNAAQTGMAGRTTFLCSDWATAISGRFDLVLCNPPYIESAVIAGLAPEVAAHEPRSALDGGDDGLAAYRRLLPHLPTLLAPGGVAVLELGQSQAPALDGLARALGFAPPSWRDDLGGTPRAMILGPIAR